MRHWRRGAGRSKRQSRAASDAVAAILRGETERRRRRSRPSSIISAPRPAGGDSPLMARVRLRTSPMPSLPSSNGWLRHLPRRLNRVQAGMLRAAAYSSAGMRFAARLGGRPGRGRDRGSRGALERLLGLGLADDWGVLDGLPYAAANPLAARWPANWTTRPEPGWPPPRCRDSGRPGDGRTALSPLIGGRWRSPGWRSSRWRPTRVTRSCGGGGRALLMDRARGRRRRRRC